MASLAEIISGIIPDRPGGGGASQSFADMMRRLGMWMNESPGIPGAEPPPRVWRGSYVDSVPPAAAGIPAAATPDNKASKAKTAIALANSDPKRLAEIAQQFDSRGVLSDTIRARKDKVTPSDEFVRKSAGPEDVPSPDATDGEVSSEDDRIAAHADDQETDPSITDSDRPAKTVTPPAGDETKTRSIVDIIGDMDKGDDLGDAQKRLAAAGITPYKPYERYKPQGGELIAMLAPLLFGALSGNMGYGARAGAAAGQGFMTGDLLRQQEQRKGIGEYGKELLGEADRLRQQREQKALRIGTLYLTEARNRVAERNAQSLEQYRRTQTLINGLRMTNQAAANQATQQWRRDQLTEQRIKSDWEKAIAEGRYDLARKHEARWDAHLKATETHATNMEKIAGKRASRTGTGQLPAGVRTADEMRKRGYLQVGKDWVTLEDAEAEMDQLALQLKSLVDKKADDPSMPGYASYTKILARYSALKRAKASKGKPASGGGSSYYDDGTDDEADLIDDTEE